MPDRTDALIVEHLPAVWRFARMLCDDRADAEDLVQDTFLNAWRRRETLRDPAAGRAWLMQIAANVHRDTARRSRVRRTTARRAAAEPSSPIGRVLQASVPPSPAERTEFEHLAASAMAELPERQREVLHLAAVERMSHATIASILGITVPNVASTLSIARRRVAATIERGRGADR